jgi:hypothetical protein
MSPDRPDTQARTDELLRLIRSAGVFVTLSRSPRAWTLSGRWTLSAFDGEGHHYQLTGNSPLALALELARQLGFQVSD